VIFNLAESSFFIRIIKQIPAVCSYRLKFFSDFQNNFLL